ncbi:MFS transporter [Pollutibacter soli]|uniref:spinster family MFS transporter n=1 Tax=Pollutibacter soli TaxID=3034157 RepID=UPI003013AE3D
MNNSSRNSYRYFVLTMLTLVYIFNFIDRQLLVILQESIKKELKLSDTQLGMLSGFTFAIFYVTLGLPIARLADKTSRRNIVAASLGLWSLMTALSGRAQNFLQLLLARIGVGVGEAGGSPPAHAMISDYFPPEKRSTALSVYSSGIYFGIMIGFLMGGYLNQTLGWRTAFFALGIPGVLFSLLFYFTVKEPLRGSTDVNAQKADESGSVLSVFRKLFSTNSFPYLSFATALNVFCIYGLSNWSPSFLSRLHHMKSTEIGIVLGLFFGIGGAFGTFFSGYLTDRYGKNDKRLYLRIPAVSVVLASLFALGGLFIQQTVVSIVCLGICASLQGMYLGPSIAVAHSLVPASMRAMTSAILFFILNLIGLGLGPLVIGFISDKLAPSLQNESLRWAMSIIVVIELFSAVLFFIAAKKLPLDLKA